MHVDRLQHDCNHLREKTGFDSNPIPATQGDGSFRFVDWSLDILGNVEVIIIDFKGTNCRALGYTAGEFVVGC